MIRPQRNSFRDFIDLSGIWRIRFDPDDVGEAEGWCAGSIPADTHPIAVPGSWNEQLAEAGFMDYLGAAWLQTDVFVPPSFEGRRIRLRCDSADFAARVFVDGEFAGESGPAFLPFEVESERLVACRTVRIVARVDNRLALEGPTPGVGMEQYVAEGRLRDEYRPAVRFDFFPYGGLNRPVWLTATPVGGIEAVKLRASADGRLTATVEAPAGSHIRISVAGQEAEGFAGEPVILRVPDVRPWSPADPALYDVAVERLDALGVVADRVELRTGFRDVEVCGHELLLNGQPVTLKGFGKHEDGPIRGRGLDLPQLVKDFGLLDWIGANSVRTSHYPYSEAFLDFADARGVLVIDEVFSVNLDFRRVTDATLVQHQAAVRALIDRDGHRPSVIAWSLANEPGYLNEPEYRSRSGPYWKVLFEDARALDPTRPLTHANVGYAGLDDPAFDQADVVSINRYFGWYQAPGQIERAVELLRADLDAVTRHGKPVFVAEFGADALAGQHSTSPQLFTEEYQADLITAFWAELERHPACIGGHVWNFADFRTAQHFRRVVLNLKGVFTRDRQPKRAAFVLRDLWKGRP
ncbi:glycoside hydrolase family 2 [Brevundimonas bacteroides]|uniref:glycoside hydrolase family 2 n=1 Tax=Brevundimonas bacteroides TaxID=74311 RepID=UPI000494E91E|nr:glycoside hydrolase family 2 [Brevundimonas bacteroides]